MEGLLCDPDDRRVTLVRGGNLFALIGFENIQLWPLRTVTIAVNQDGPVQTRWSIGTDIDVVGRALILGPMRNGLLTPCTIPRRAIEAEISWMSA